MVKEDLSLNIDKKKVYNDEPYLITKSGYVFQRRIFRLYALCVVILAVVFFFSAGGFGKQYAYSACGNDFIGNNLPCENMLYDKCDLPACQKPVLQPGEVIGERPRTDLSERLIGASLLGLVAAFLLNHIINNFDNESKKKARSENARYRIKSKKRKGN